MSSDKISKLLGYPANSELKKLILSNMAEEKKTMIEICRRYATGPLIMLDKNGQFNYKGRTWTPAEWDRENPCMTLIALKYNKS